MHANEWDYERFEHHHDEQKEQDVLDSMEEQEDVAVALTRDGRLVEYDVAVEVDGCNDRYFATLRKFTCLGRGIIHSVNGELYEDNTQYRFYLINK